MVYIVDFRYVCRWIIHSFGKERLKRVVCHIGLVPTINVSPYISPLNLCYEECPRAQVDMRGLGTKQALAYLV